MPFVKGLNYSVLKVSRLLFCWLNSLGPAELCWRLFWVFIPQALRVRISLKIVDIQKRTHKRIPYTRYVVYLLADSSCAKYFPEYKSPPDNTNLPSYSLVATCLNEEENCVEWAESVVTQTHLPSEIIVCDAGSSDSTVKLIESVFESYNFSNVKILTAKDVNIAKGRNIAVNAARCNYIACTDLGSVLEKKWAECLMGPFMSERNLNLSMGFYRPRYISQFSRAVSHFILPDISVVDPGSFLPSARSMAVSRKLWEDVGGFPEELTFAGEDSLFALKVKEKITHVAFVPDAQVVWRCPARSWQLFHMIRRYARGDAEGGELAWGHYWWLVCMMSSVGFETVAGVMLVFLGLAYSQIVVAFGGLLLLIATCRLIEGILRYQPFKGIKREGNLALSQRLLRTSAVYLVMFAQCVGFIQGLTFRFRKRL